VEEGDGGRVGIGGAVRLFIERKRECVLRRVRVGATALDCFALVKAAYFSMGRVRDMEVRWGEVGHFALRVGVMKVGVGADPG